MSGSGKRILSRKRLRRGGEWERLRFWGEGGFLAMLGRYFGGLRGANPPYGCCVAELSRNILQSGKEFCTLYTDLANPTSNSIYMKIGYKPVCDSVEYTFEM